MSSTVNSGFTVPRLDGLNHESCGALEASSKKKAERFEDVYRRKFSKRSTTLPARYLPTRCGIFPPFSPHSAVDGKVHMPDAEMTRLLREAASINGHVSEGATETFPMSAGNLLSPANRLGAWLDGHFLLTFNSCTFTPRLTCLRNPIFIMFSFADQLSTWRQEPSIELRRVPFPRLKFNAPLFLLVLVDHFLPNLSR